MRNVHYLIPKFTISSDFQKRTILKENLCVNHNQNLPEKSMEI